MYDYRPPKKDDIFKPLNKKSRIPSYSEPEDSGDDGSKSEFSVPSRISDIPKPGNIAVVAVVVLLVISVGMAANYLGYSSSLEGQVVDISGDLQNANQEIEKLRTEKQACEDDVSGLEEDIRECSSRASLLEDDLGNCETWLVEERANSADLRSGLERCMSGKSEWENKYSKQMDVYDKIIPKYAKALCCSISDVENSVDRNFGISGSSITCSGSYYVNCRSGENNFGME